MRLLTASDNEKWSLTPDLSGPPAPYAILSHTWGTDDDEVNFRDLQDGSGEHKSGSTKLWFCASQASKDGLKYSWIDTCCIDRANHVELSEAITSMFVWYQRAERCYVYLSDVSAENEDGNASQEQWESAFRNSRWFKRGWTLQELLAPTIVEFYSREHRLLGSKKTLEHLIHDITRISIDALRGQHLSYFSVDERLLWTKGRQTRKVEDRAYCLLGVFGVSMSLRYGEGEQALVRLERKVKGLTKNTENHELINWLAPSRPRELHAKAVKLRHPGTGLYFTEDILISWLGANNDCSSLLWITGKSGSGKSTLFSNIVDAMDSFVSQHPTMAFAYHYCAFSDPDSQQLINILGSLIVQIANWQPNILRDIKAVFENDQDRKKVKSLQTWELEQLIVKYGARFSTLVLLIDAANESEDLFEFCASIERLLKQVLGLKVLVTSTGNVTTTSMAQTVRWDQMEMNPSEDIKTFVDYTLTHHVALRYLSAECKCKVRTTLLTRADQSFRWVAIVLDSLARQRTEKAVLRVLTQIPGDLYNTYAEMLRMIPASDRDIAREVLLWVCFAKRPMTLPELSEAAIIEDCDGALSQETRLFKPTIILDICHGFLDYDSHTEKVKLAHFSVRDYLLSEQMKTQGDTSFSFSDDQGHQHLMRRCLTYLLFDNFSTASYCTSDGQPANWSDFKLFNYAAHHWGSHAGYATESEWSMAQRFFSTRALRDGANYGAWGTCLMAAWDIRTVVETEPVYYAASLGMASLLQALLSGKINLEAQNMDLDKPGGRFGSTALHVACWRGRRECAKLLVKAGADFLSDDPGTDEPAWFWAESNGWEDVVYEMVKIKPIVAQYIKEARADIQRAQGILKYEKARAMGALS